MFSKAKKDAATRDLSGSAFDISGKEGASASMTSTKKGAPISRSGVPSIISGDVQLTGTVKSHGEVQLDGELDGDIHAGTLIIGEKAVVRGEVICEQVTVRGRVEGGVRARQVVLANTAYIQGDILHSSLSVETGAFFEGRARHSDDPLSDSAAAEFRADRPAVGSRREEPRAPEVSADDGDDTVATLRPKDPLAPEPKKAAGGGSFLGQGKAPLR